MAQIPNADEIPKKPTPADIYKIERAGLNSVIAGGALCCGKGTIFEMSKEVITACNVGPSFIERIGMSDEIRFQTETNGIFAINAVEIKKIIANGQMVPNKLTCPIILAAILRRCNALAGVPRGTGPYVLILDGFPRDAAQEGYLRLLRIAYKPVCITIPRELYDIRAIERAKKQGRPDDAKQEIRDVRWNLWLTQTLPMFRAMDRRKFGSRVCWIDGTEPLIKKVRTFIGQLGFDSITFGRICNYLDNTTNPVTKQILEIDNPKPKWPANHIGAVPLSDGSEGTVPSWLRGNLFYQPQQLAAAAPAPSAP